MVNYRFWTERETVGAGRAEQPVHYAASAAAAAWEEEEVSAQKRLDGKEIQFLSIVIRS